jgi:hypothetical protein
MYKIMLRVSAAASSGRWQQELPKRSHRTGARSADQGDSAAGRRRSRLESLIAPTIERSLSGAGRLESMESGGRDSKIPPTMADEDLVNALAQYLDLEPLEKQALLEQHSLRTRAESLVELLEMKLLIARTPGLSNVAH